jgi:hypothetical protein
MPSVALLEFKILEFPVNVVAAMSIIVFRVPAPQSHCPAVPGARCVAIFQKYGCELRTPTLMYAIRITSMHNSGAAVCRQLRWRISTNRVTYNTPATCHLLLLQSFVFGARCAVSAC